MSGVDLTTRYMGLELAHPVMPSPSPLTGDVEHIAALVDAGAPAVVLPSLFEEQIEHDAMAVHYSLELGADGFGEATGGFFPELGDYNTGPEDYLGLIRSAKDEFDIPIIASLNGVSLGGWTRFAEILADQGADGLELNTYRVAADVTESTADVEESYLRLVETVRARIEIPLAIKVGPYFSSMGDMTRRLVDAGADAIVMFNRFYQPDINLEDLSVEPGLHLSTPGEQTLVIRWLAVLFGKVDCDLAATTGIHSGEGAVKAILAGADVAMMASALLKYGPQALTTTRDGLEAWLVDNDYDSVAQARGSISYESVPDPSVFERTGYMRTLNSYVPSW